MPVSPKVAPSLSFPPAGSPPSTLRPLTQGADEDCSPLFLTLVLPQLDLFYQAASKLHFSPLRPDCSEELFILSSVPPLLFLLTVLSASILASVASFQAQSLGFFPPGHPTLLRSMSHGSDTERVLATPTFMSLAGFSYFSGLN